MKRKNEIPDFSKKKKGPQPHGVPDATKVQQPHGVPDAAKVQQPHTPAPPVRAGKPPATSMKSGRRGS
jgi:hypothetical protein